MRNRLAADALPPSVARVYSQHVRLRAGELLPTWTQDEADERLLDVVRLIDAAEEARDDSSASRAAYRRAAELLEWLDHPRVNTDAMPLGLLGAACYHLAGFPARAATLASAQSDPERDAPLLRLLLRGDFPALLLGASDAAFTGHSALRALGSLTNYADWYRLATAEVASALGVLAADFRWGDEQRRSRALDKLRAASKVFRDLADPFSWLLAKLSADVAETMIDASIRVPLAGLAETSHSEVGQRAFEGYARQRFLERRSIAWPSQIRGLEKVALGDSFALCTPTGSGKTTVAEVALLDGLFRDPEESARPLCLYIVPTRALAAEVESKLSVALRRAQTGLPVTVTGLYGGTDWGPSDGWLRADEPTVLICTQEKADALVRYLGWSVVGRLRLVVIDEAHEIAAPEASSDLVAGESRGLRLETLVARLRARLGDATRFVAMSAVAEQIEGVLARWVAGNDQGLPVRSTYRSTRQVVGRLRCREGRTLIVFDYLDGLPLQVQDREALTYVPQPFPQVPAADGMDGVQKALAPYALWAATQLAAARPEGSPQSVLVSIATQVRNWSSWCLDLVNQWGDELPPFFEEPDGGEDRELWVAAQRACDDYFGAGSIEGKLLERGIAVHYGRMPGRLPRLIVQLIERRVVRVVVATSGLSQGVNLPFETVLIPLLRRQNQRMAASEFWNLVGRAGRPGVSTEGQTLVLVNEDDTATWRRRQVREDLRALALRSEGDELPTDARPLADLLRLLRTKWGEGDDEAFFGWLEATAPLDLPDSDDEAIGALDTLDAVLLAALVDGSEQEGPAAVEDTLRRFWRSAFSHYAAEEEERLENIVLHRGAAVARLYDDDQRRKLYLTSLPPRQATRLRDVAERLRTHLETGGAYATLTSGEQLNFVVAAVEILAEHPRFAPRATVGQSRRTWQEVLTWWLTGWEAAVSPNAAQAGRWHDFINRYFAYRFNWALGSALSLLAADSQGPDEGFDLDGWSATGLPWISVWLKDLVEWGTLDPVAAYLLARGGHVTRPDAEGAATAYYESETAAAFTDPLNPQGVREWTLLSTQRTAGDTGRLQGSFAAVAVHGLPGDALTQAWRVVPTGLVDGEIKWLDPAGRHFATSGPPEGWDDSTSPYRFDFEYHPTDGEIRVSRYV